jgi:acyl-coenzyme A thioesterase PaaI-like protein
MTSKQPNSSQCFVCGVENPNGLHLTFYDSAPGEVTADYRVPAHFQGYPGVTHGGIIASMLDEVTGRAFMQGDPPRFMVTAKLSIRYRKPVPTERPIRLVGRAVRDEGHVAYAAGEIYGEDGTLLAEAEAVLVNIPPATLATMNVDALGWRVYPDNVSTLEEESG